MHCAPLCTTVSTQVGVDEAFLPALHSLGRRHAATAAAAPAALASAGAGRPARDAAVSKSATLTPSMLRRSLVAAAALQSGEWRAPRLADLLAEHDLVKLLPLVRAKYGS